MKTTLKEIAKLVDGHLIGDENIVIEGVAPLYQVKPGQITLYDTQDSRSRGLIKNASALLVTRGIVIEDRPTIEVDQVHEAFAKIIQFFRPARNEKRIGISPQAVVSSTARIGKDVDIHPLAIIEDHVEIGDGSTIHSGVRIMSGTTIGKEVTIFPNAVLYENSVIGDRCILHATSVIGAYGFGYDQVDGRHELSAQLGNVVLGDDVEIGASSTVDRGTYGSTIIGEGTKVDNQVMIAHNCHIGCHNLICSQVGIAGSTSTGDYVVMAGQVGVRDHVHIGEGAVLGAMAGIINDVQPGACMVGIPATPERDQMIKQVVLSKLPEMRRQLKHLIQVVEKATGESLVKNKKKGFPRRAA